MRAEELEKEERLNKQLFSGSQVSEKAELLCEHKGSGKPPFAHGLCESCYSDVSTCFFHLSFPIWSI